MWAHHDGSALYVSSSRPELDDLVTVRMRIAHDASIDVSVRTVEDGEPRFWPAEHVEKIHGEDWFQAQIRVRNPVTNYRFLLTGDGIYRWLNGAGLHSRDVSDAHDFRLTIYPSAPPWARTAVLYQIFPDRFATTGVAQSLGLPDWGLPRPWDSAPAPEWPETSMEIFGGDLPGITAKLDYLQDLGVTGVYLTPVFPGQSNHRYDASTFTEVDPLLGGDDALVELSAALHSRGMRIVGDLTTNHTGDGHEWFRIGKADPSSVEHDFYYWLPDGTYECWLGVSTLPKLNYHCAELWQRFITGPESVVGRWLQEPFNLDGWRIDVANMTGRRGDDDFAHAVARTVVRTATDINPDALVIGEHFHDATGDVDGDGWHANMNYTGFTRPLWAWLVEEGTDLPFIGMPATIPSLPGGHAVESMNDFLAQIPWRVRSAQWNMLGSHDTARIRSVVGSDERLIVAAAALLTLPGTPVIFSGDELAQQGITGEQSRTTIPWGSEYDTKSHVRDAYRSLISLRSSTPALTEGGLRWLLLDDDALGFVRETTTDRVVVVLTRRSFTGQLHVPGRPFGDLTEVFATAMSAQLSDETANPPGAGVGINLKATGPGVIVLRDRV